MANTQVSYEQFVDSAFNLDMLDSREEAEDAVKMVLGIAASRLEEQPAHALADNLPEPLTFQKLRSHQATPTDISAAQYIHDVAIEYGLSNEDAEQLILSIWSVAEDAIGEDNLKQVLGGFPKDWRVLVEPVSKAKGLFGFFR